MLKTSNIYIGDNIMKVYAVVYHDYEEHTTKYICNTKELAKELATQLIERDHRFDSNYQNNSKDRACPTYVVNEFDILESIDNVMPTPKYVRVTVEYVDKGTTLVDHLDIKNIGPETMYYDSNILPSFAKHISVLVSRSTTSPDTNDIEFNMFIPICDIDDFESIKTKVVKLITDAINDIGKKGCPLNYVRHMDVRNFNPKLWNIKSICDWYLAVATIPNILMINANIIDNKKRIK